MKNQPEIVDATALPKPALLPSAMVQFAENILAAIRTAGALLMGNSALIYFNIVGTNADAFLRVLLTGITLFVVCSFPVAVIERNRNARTLLKSNPQKGN